MCHAAGHGWLMPSQVDPPHPSHSSQPPVPLEHQLSLNCPQVPDVFIGLSITPRHNLHGLPPHPSPACVSKGHHPSTYRLLVGNLLSEVVPLEVLQVLDTPEVIIVCTTPLAANFLAIDCISYTLGDALVGKLHPPLCEVFACNSIRRVIRQGTAAQVMAWQGSCAAGCMGGFSCSSGLCERTAAFTNPLLTTCCGT